jgi:outer membrane protein TolC
MIRFKTFLTAMVLALSIPASAQLSIDECQRLAQENYPLLKKYDLISQTTGYTVENIGKGYLPQVSAIAQATYQSSVSELPDAMKSMLASSGNEYKGMKKDEYKLGVDVSQLVWDGGNIKAQKQVAKLQGETQTLQTETDMYAVRERVNNLFFGILLTNERIKLNQDLQKLLKSNCDKLESMKTGGTAMQSDVNAVKAEYLKTRQQMTELESNKASLLTMLGIFIGKKIDGELLKPSATVPSADVNNRPELKLFDAQLNQVKAQNAVLDAAVKPRLSLFAQGYYGYPSYNMFKSMNDHNLSLNGLVGVKLTWSIGSLYTRKNDKRKLDLAASEIENARDVFLFNNRLQTAQDNATIEQYRKMMAEDDEIIKLRTSVRESAEYKLSHGIILVNDLLREITNENEARIGQSTHEIEMLKSIYELKNTINQ